MGQMYYKDSSGNLVPLGSTTASPIQEGLDPATGNNGTFFYDTDATSPAGAVTQAVADANYANRVTTTTDNAVVRFDGTTGSLQNSGVTITDNGSLFLGGLNNLHVGEQAPATDGVFCATLSSSTMLYLFPSGASATGRLRSWVSNGTTGAGRTAVGANRLLLSIDARGWGGGTGYRGGSGIDFSTDDDGGSYAYSDTSMPGKITFNTAANGSVATNERMKIDSAGLVTVAGTLKTGTPVVNRNLVINGAMQVSQRSTSVANITVLGYYTADRWIIEPLTLGTWTQSVENDAPTGSGLRKSLKVYCSTADSSPAAGDYVIAMQKLEGQNLQHLAKGTASAQQLTVSFWVKSNKTGTYIAELFDYDNSRNVNKSYSISSADTWTQVSLTFPADTTGALDNDNNASLGLFFWLGNGSNFTGGTLQESWGASNNVNRAVGQTNLGAAVGNYWQITGVQLEAGNAATNFEFEPYETTLRKCQRYYYRVNSSADEGGNFTNFAYGRVSGTNTVSYVAFPLAVKMRATQTLSTSNVANFAIDDGAGGTAPSAIDPDQMNVLTPSLRITHAAKTVGRACTLFANNSTTCWLALSAEL